MPKNGNPIHRSLRIPNMERRFLGFGIAASSALVALGAVAYSSQIVTPLELSRSIYNTNFAEQKGFVAETSLEKQFRQIERIYSIDQNSTELPQALWFTFDQMVKNYPTPQYVLAKVDQLRPIISKSANEKSLLQFAVESIFKSQRELGVVLNDEELDQVLSLIIESQIGQTRQTALQAMIFGLSEIRSDRNWLAHVQETLLKAPFSQEQVQTIHAAIGESSPNGLNASDQSAHVLTYRKIQMRKMVSPLSGRRPVLAESPETGS